VLDVRQLVAEVTIPGNPKSKDRPRTFRAPNGRMRTITPEATITKQREIGWIVKCDMRERGTDEEPDGAHAFEVSIQIHERKAASQQADGDNVLKLIMDALNGIVWADDRQVTDARAKVCDRQAATPRTEISIYRLGRIQ